MALLHSYLQLRKIVFAHLCENKVTITLGDVRVVIENPPHLIYNRVVIENFITLERKEITTYEVLCDYVPRNYIQSAINRETYTKAMREMEVIIGEELANFLLNSKHPDINGEERGKIQEIMNTFFCKDITSIIMSYTLNPQVSIVKI